MQHIQVSIEMTLNYILIYHKCLSAHSEVQFIFQRQITFHFVLKPYLIKGGNAVIFIHLIAVSMQSSI